MARWTSAAAAALLCALPASARHGHGSDRSPWASAQLAWVMPATHVDATPITGALVANVYQALTSSGTFTLIAGRVAGTAFVAFPPASAGDQWCYRVTVVEVGVEIESAPSNAACKTF